jgi:hypothetical protein
MTKNERQIIIEHYAEYIISYGFYLEELEHTHNETDRISLASTIEKLADKANAIYEIMKDLDIKVDTYYTEIGRKKYRELHK